MYIHVYIYIYGNIHFHFVSYSLRVTELTGSSWRKRMPFFSVSYCYIYMYMCIIRTCLRDEEGRKKEASKVIQTNKAKQHSTPKAVTFPRKKELPRVGLKPTTLYTLDRALYQLSYRRYYCTSTCTDCLGCAVLLCLVCLFDLACFFLSSFSSLI